MRILLARLIRRLAALRRPTPAENARALAARGESPGELTVREATAADIPALAALHVRTWHATYADLTLTRRIRSPTLAIREAQWRQAFAAQDGSWFCYVVARPAGELVGFIKGVRGDDGAGEVSKLHFDREYQRLGLGRRLLCIAVHRFLAEGRTSMKAFVDPRNPSCGFFERMGGEWLREQDGRVNPEWYVWRHLSEAAAACRQHDDGGIQR